jgi:alkylhydroperoxidase family enzyme
MSGAARIAPVSEPDPEQAEILAKTLMGPDGAPLNLFTTLAHRPRLLRRVNALGGYFMAHGSVPAREREIVILRVAARTGSVYEEAQHRWIAPRTGLSAEEIEGALDPEGGATAFGEDDRPLLELVDELVATDTVSDALWERLGARWDDDERVEMLVLAGFYRMLAGLLNGVRVEVDASVA